MDISEVISQLSEYKLLYKIPDDFRTKMDGLIKSDYETEIQKFNVNDPQKLVFIVDEKDIKVAKLYKLQMKPIELIIFRYVYVN